jgi:hypothetical protein
MSYDPKTGGPCAVADIRRGALDDIAEVLRGYLARNKEESMNRDNQSQPMNAHTPTPWYADQDQREGYEWNVHIVEHDRPHMRICFMSNGEHSQANARLIVEAVNSYASLKARIAKLERALTWIVNSPSAHPANMIKVAEEGLRHD